MSSPARCRFHPVAFGLLLCLVIPGVLPAEPPGSQEAQEFLRLATQCQRQWAAKDYDAAEQTVAKIRQITERSFLDKPDVLYTVVELQACLACTKGQQAAAEEFCKRAIAMKQRESGPQDAGLVLPLDLLATLYSDQGRYAEAEPLFRRLLAIRQKMLGTEHPDVAETLSDLGILYYKEGRYRDAEPLYKQSLAIREKTLGAGHADTAANLSNLAALYNTLGRYAEAEPLLNRALAILEKVPEQEREEIASVLANLVCLYRDHGRYAEAERLAKRALAIRERLLGPDHPDFAASLTCLANLYHAQGRSAEAESFHKRALAILEKAQGKNHPDIAVTLNNLGNLCREQRRYAEAESLHQRALAIREKALGPQHPDIAYDLGNLASLYCAQNRYAEAEPLLDRAIAILDASGSEPDLQWTTRRNRATMCWQLGRRQDALADLNRAMDLAEDVYAKGSGGEKEHAALFFKYAGVFEMMVAWQCELGNVGQALRAAERARARLLVRQSPEGDGSARPAEGPPVTKDFKPVPLDRLQVWVAQQEALLLEYVLGEEGGFLFVISPFHEPQLLRLELTAEQAKASGVHAGPLTVRRMCELMTLDGKPLESILSQPEPSPAAVSRMALLWQLLVPAAEQKVITGGKLKRLMIVPDGRLTLLPFDKLVVEPGERPKELRRAGPPILSGSSATILYNLSTRKTVTSSGGDLVQSAGKPARRLDGGASETGFIFPAQSALLWSVWRDRLGNN